MRIINGQLHRIGTRSGIGMDRSKDVGSIPVAEVPMRIDDAPCRGAGKCDRRELTRMRIAGSECGRRIIGRNVGQSENSVLTTYVINNYLFHIISARSSIGMHGNRCSDRRGTAIAKCPFVTGERCACSSTASICKDHIERHTTRCGQRREIGYGLAYYHIIRSHEGIEAAKAVYNNKPYGMPPG